ncbi:MAG: hypothetical protein NT075_02545 [Chloroflexi bacterium]|nr:hypothetical protein [Chloroflexota bacterium]
MTKQQPFSAKLYWLYLIIPLALLVTLGGGQGQVYAQQAAATVQPTATPIPQPLNWTEPPTPRVQLAASAMAANDTIIYTIYPMNTTGQPVWDLQINVPLPEGATFLTAWGPPTFATSFDGRQVTFSALELPDQNQAIALHFQVSSAKVTTPAAVTQAAATWKYVKTNLGQITFAQESTKSGDITVQPHAIQQVISDMTGDVPFGNYDLTGIALEQEQTILKIIFNTAGNLGASTEKLEYYLYIDDDCNANTGRQRNGFGSEYRVRFRYTRGIADISKWAETVLLTTTVATGDTAPVTDTEAITDTGNVSDTTGTKAGEWQSVGSLSVSSPANGKIVTVWVPHSALVNGTKFCWYAEAQNKTEAFTPKPPTDELPDASGDLPVIQYDAAMTTTAISLNQPLTTTGGSKNAALSIPLVLTPTVPLTTGVNGNLAIPLKNGETAYDVHIFHLPDGQEVAKIANASQPSFSPDGQSLLSVHQTAQAATVYEYALANKAEVALTGVISGSYPFYDASGKALIYAKAAPGQPADSAAAFVRCDLMALRQHTPPQCQTVLDFAALAATGQISKSTGNGPILTANNLAAYQGCIDAADVNRCGIFMGGVLATDSAANEPFLRQLTNNQQDIPTDSKGNLIAFMGRGADDWEVYVTRLDGAWVKNVSNNADAQDGLPTLSPDGKWVAFLSNRDDKWAVWVAPIAEGPARKVFDLPTGAPWDEGAKNWQDQRITWAP